MSHIDNIGKIFVGRHSEGRVWGVLGKSEEHPVGQGAGAESAKGRRSAVRSEKW